MTHKSEADLERVPVTPERDKFLLFLFLKGQVPQPTVRRCSLSVRIYSDLILLFFSVIPQMKLFS